MDEGYVFDNPVYDEHAADVVDDDDDQQTQPQIHGEDAIGAEQTQREQLPHVDEETRNQKERMVNEFYEHIKNNYGWKPKYIRYDNFKLVDGILHLEIGNKEISLMSKDGKSFLALSTLEKNIGKQFSLAMGGTTAIREMLHLPEYTSGTKKLSPKDTKILQNAESTIGEADTILKQPFTGEEIEMGDLRQMEKQ